MCCLKTVKSKSSKNTKLIFLDKTLGINDDENVTCIYSFNGNFYLMSHVLENYKLKIGMKETT